MDAVHQDPDFGPAFLWSLIHGIDRIAARFHTLFLEDVPVLGPANHHEARRFVTLIDALYEAGTRLVVLAEAAPEALYREGVGAFEFERTASRLNEMAGADWLARERTA